MRRPRFSIGWLMFGVAMLGVLFALLQNALNGHQITGKMPATDMGLWPMLIAFGAASFSILKNRGARRPFLWGFVCVGWVSVLAYLAVCIWMPQIVEIPVRYYLNEIDYWWIVWLIDADSYEGYVANLLFMGLILALPQLVVATLGGLIARWNWGTRWTMT